MDEKIRDIEMFNCLLVWQHTALKTGDFINASLVQGSSKVLSIGKKHFLVQQGSIGLLNVVIIWRAADFVLKNRVCCFFYRYFLFCVAVHRLLQSFMTGF